MNAMALSALGPVAATVGAGLVSARAAFDKLGSVTTGSSARSQNNIDNSLNQLSRITSANTAQSAAQAAALRRWQEEQNDKAMQFSAKEAAKNRDWQKMMSDTAHQREIRDLQAAGLNPVLSAMGGNGAAVGSGATASGVTSSGAKGEVDTSMSHGLVSLLSTMLQAQTNLAQTAMSAKSNEAIALRNNATSELIAHLTGQYGLSREALSGDYGLRRQAMSDTAALQRTDLQGRYSIGSANIHAQATRDAAAQAAAASRYAADTQYAIHRDFPSGIAGLINSIAGSIVGADSGTKSMRESIEALAKLAASGETNDVLKALTGLGDILGQATIFGGKLPKLTQDALGRYNGHR